MKKVFCLYSIYGSGDGDTEFQLEAICETIERALEEAKRVFSYFKDRRINPINKKMNIENSFTFIGSREDADEIHGCGYDNAGGFVIEETEVLS